MDRILLEGVRCRARVGVPDRERRTPQRIDLDLALELDLRAAARTDDVRRTADYWAVERHVRAAKRPAVMPKTGRVVVELRRVRGAR